MKPDLDYADYIRKWSSLYEGKNYDEGIAGYFLTKSHEWCEAPFSESTHFGRVLEVGAGTGIHIDHVRHRFDEYLITDINAPILDRAAGRLDGLQGKVSSKSEDATALSFADESFDRVIATHVLEHLPRPHEVLREWNRVLKPGGTLSIVLPCDPGLAWRLGRAIGARRKFVRLGIDYDYWMAREHINAINNLVAFIRYYFPECRREFWRPLFVPSIDANLFFITHITK